MPEASADDVRVEIQTGLSDDVIEGVDSDADDDGLLGRVAREIDRAYDETSVEFDDQQHRRDFEAVLAALRIAEGFDRRVVQKSLGTGSKTYETSEIESLRKRVRRTDPGDEFGHSGRVVRDTGRHISRTDHD